MKVMTKRRFRMHKISLTCLVMDMGMTPSFSFADALSVMILPGEKWWGAL